ncbi:FAD-dependent oxidoreductase [Psychrobacter sp. I-STPA10]|uniref:FAD-dependent oxidoreductase n=1 Tax=Psychrobacter sp. I-STPA10 TaxID=2585769 RepID=UPI001E571414|nr:FAD-dependent oxidoreductase [Psychrobacter sp. I-STPA10]
MTRQTKLHVGIIGGGIAGATIAIRLAALGIQTTVFERTESLVNGPPMCHLHAGGNLYREIPDSDCVSLLKQAIEMIRLYPSSIDVRPTLIAIPKHDHGSPLDLLPRLQLLTATYAQLIKQDNNNKVLGEVDNYFQTFERTELEALARLPKVDKPCCTQQWMIAAAKLLDLDQLKYPVIAVQEYGWNIFRLAACTQLALAQYPNAQILTNTQVTQVTPCYGDTLQWTLEYLTTTTHIDSPPPNTKQAAVQPQTQSITVDYLINACGFRTGQIDDMVGISAERMLEFKASYVAHWQQNASEYNGVLPEIIIHGVRGTAQAMAQLTPYPNGYYQIHAMSKDITLFADGLVKTESSSAQPQLNPVYLKYINDGWHTKILQQRSQKAIDYVSQFVPAFANAIPTRNALYGAQQIPGQDDSLRVADVSLYREQHYARAENVKASSALFAADEVVQELLAMGFICADTFDDTLRQHHQWQYLQQASIQDIEQLATTLSIQRQFPPAMAKVNNAVHLTDETI